MNLKRVWKLNTKFMNIHIWKSEMAFKEPLFPVRFFWFFDFYI